jgi:cytosine/adenosine deaminase-related metal-dependent hydrolase
MGAIYSVHASELYREDPGPLLDLDPDFAVHMVSGSEDDWKALARAGIPVCICPRANSAFGIRTPLYEMDRAGLRLVLGTDNALVAKQDMWREMEAAWTLLRRGGMGGTEASRRVFEMASGRTLEGTRIGAALGAPGWWAEGWPPVGGPAMLTVLRVPEGDGWMDAPYDHIVRFSGPEDVIGPRHGRTVRDGMI